MPEPMKPVEAWAVVNPSGRILFDHRIGLAVDTLCRPRDIITRELYSGEEVRPVVIVDREEWERALVLQRLKGAGE